MMILICSINAAPLSAPQPTNPKCIRKKTVLYLNQRLRVQTAPPHLPGKGAEDAKL